MGIQMNPTSHEDVRIMYGNPFDTTITIEKIGRTVTEKVENGPCDRCQKVHLARFITKMAIRKGRWFFVDKRQMECTQCGGKFGASAKIYSTSDVLAPRPDVSDAISCVPCVPSILT